jgi:hypothetical protein
MFAIHAAAMKAHQTIELQVCKQTHGHAVQFSFVCCFQLLLLLQLLFLLLLVHCSCCKCCMSAVPQGAMQAKGRLPQPWQCLQGRRSHEQIHGSTLAEPYDMLICSSTYAWDYLEVPCCTIITNTLAVAGAMVCGWHFHTCAIRIQSLCLFLHGAVWQLLILQQMWPIGHKPTTLRVTTPMQKQMQVKHCIFA